MHSEKAIRSRSCHRGIQAAHPLDAPRKPTSLTLRPRPSLRFFPQSRQKPDDRPTYVRSLLNRRFPGTFSLWSSIDLAVIFRPGLISHPDHELLPAEHLLSQDVLEFLIALRDWFIPIV